MLALRVPTFYTFKYSVFYADYYNVNGQLVTNCENSSSCPGESPAGCFQNGCSDGSECVDFGNSNYGEFCVASSCSCDESYIYQSYWSCTDDCNGGTCVPDDPQPGDLCVLEESSVGLSIPGFVECDGQCIDYIYYE